MADILKVLMMGGQRVGKTSMLAGLIDTMTNGSVKEFVVAENKTDNVDATRKLEKSIESLKSHLNASAGKTFLIDDNKTNTFNDYTLQFCIPNTDSKMDIVFSDLNGEFFDMGRSHDGEIREMVRNYDVFIVVIDTPSLMEAANHDNKLCNEAINNSYNHVNDIHTFLSELDDKDGADAKLVIFAPLKCEKWVKEGRTSEIISRVKAVYSKTIQALAGYTNVEIDIIPIQTAGNIVFKEHSKSMLCTTNGLNPRRCAIVDGKRNVRFENGEIQEIDLSVHKFYEDSEAVIREGSSLIKPNSWFTAIGRDYSPKNCDQIAFYILQFYLAKVLFAKNVEDLQKNKKRWKWGKRIAITVATLAFGLVGAAITYFSSKYLAKKFGTISLEQMVSLLKKLNKGGYIKRNCDGIVTLKESDLNKFD